MCICRRLYKIDRLKIGILAGFLTLLYFINFEEILLHKKSEEERISDAISIQNTRHKLTKNIIKYQILSKCDCRRNESIDIENQNIYDLYEVSSALNNSKYTVKVQEIDELVCGVYETLRRGHHQKVIGYSLYGKAKRYTHFLKSRKYKI